MASRLETDVEGLELPAAASVEFPSDERNRFVLTLSPHETLWIDKPVAFELRVPISYPAMPPIVTCLSQWVTSKLTKGGVTVDTSGKVAMTILNFDNGWNRSYTVSAVVYSLWYLLRKPGVPNQRRLPCESGDVATVVTTVSGEAGLQGRRGSMEDAACNFDKGSIHGHADMALYAIFDGHGGDKASEFAARQFPKVFMRTLQQRGGAVDKALYDSCLTCDADFFKHVAEVAGKSGMDSDQSGTTACIVAIKGSELTTANLGDSRAVLSRGGDAVALTKDHKAAAPEEVARIVHRGGFVANNRVLGWLAVARALGDASFKSVGSKEDGMLVSNEPDIVQGSICEDDEFMVVACDGLFDVMSNQDVIDFARPRLAAGTTPGKMAAELAQHAIDSGSTDNVSVIVVVLNEGVVDTTRRRVTVRSPQRSSKGRKGSTTGPIPASVLALGGGSADCGPSSSSGGSGGGRSRGSGGGGGGGNTNPFSSAAGGHRRGASSNNPFSSSYRGLPDPDSPSMTDLGGTMKAGSSAATTLSSRGRRPDARDPTRELVRNLPSSAGGGGAGGGAGAGARSRAGSGSGAARSIVAPSGSSTRHYKEPYTPSSRPSSSGSGVAHNSPVSRVASASAIRRRNSGHLSSHNSMNHMMSPRVAAMSEADRRRLSREAARLLEASGILGGSGGGGSSSRPGSGSGSGSRPGSGARPGSGSSQGSGRRSARSHTSPASSSKPARPRYHRSHTTGSAAASGSAGAKKNLETADDVLDFLLDDTNFA